MEKFDNYLRIKQERREAILNGDKRRALELLQELKSMDISDEDRILLNY